MSIKNIWLNYKDSIKTKLIINVILIHTILMSLIVFDLLDKERNFIEKQLSQKGYDLTYILSKSIAVPYLNNDLIAINEILSDTNNTENTNLIFALDKRLKVKASTKKGYFSKTLNDDISKNIVKKLILSNKNSFQIIHHNLVDTIQTIEVDGRVIGYLRTLINEKVLIDKLAVITKKGLLYIFVAILLGAIFAWLSIRTMAKNLHIVSKAADEISKKNFSIQLEHPTSNDEIAKIIKTFNIMSKSIKNYINELEKSNKIIQREKNLAEITLSSIGDCVIVTDQNGFVTFINPSAQKILNYTQHEARGQKIDKLFKIYKDNTSSELQSSIYEAIQNKKVIWHSESVILINRDFKKFDIEKSASPIVSLEGTVEGAVLVFYDVTQKKKAELDTRWNATHDSLTKLNNRTAFDVILTNLVKRVQRDSSHHVFFFMDLDKFKTINDSVGHLVGDRVLKDIAKLLKSNLRDNDFLFRFGGDEFGVILFDCNLRKAKKIAQNFIDKVLQYKIDVNGKTFQIGLSIGISEIDTKKVMQLAY